MDYIVKLFGRFDRDDDDLSGSSRELLEGTTSVWGMEDGVKKKRSGEIPGKHPTFVGYLKDMFEFKSDEPRELELDEDGYIKKLYSERDEPRPKSLLVHVNEFFGVKSEQLTSLDDKDSGGEMRKTLAKVIAHHGNEWFQEIGNESEDVEATSVSSEALRMGGGRDSIKKTEDERDFFDARSEELLSKIAAHHGNEWFQDLGAENREEGDIADFLKQLEDASGFQIPEVKLKFLSYLADLLDTKLENPQEKVRKLFGMESDKLEESAEQVSPQNADEDTQIHNEIKNQQVSQAKEGFFRSKPEVQLADKTTHGEESEEIVSIAVDDFQKEAGDERIVPELVQEALDTRKSPKRIPTMQADEVTPPVGLIECAVDVAKLFSKWNYPLDEEQATRRAIADESYEEISRDYLESADEGDVFEEALSDDEGNLTHSGDQNSSTVEKGYSIFHKIYHSGFTHILPSSLLQQYRQIISSNDDDVKDEGVENEDVFEDALDVSFDQANEDSSSCVNEEVCHSNVEKKSGIIFLVGGDDPSRIVVLRKNEEEEFTIAQDAFPNFKDADHEGTKILTISAADISDHSKSDRLYDAKLNAQEPRRKDSTKIAGNLEVNRRQNLAETNFNAKEHSGEGKNVSFKNETQDDDEGLQSSLLSGKNDPTAKEECAPERPWNRA